MTEKYLAMIPARLDSTRLPNKMIKEVGNKPVIVHTIDRVLKCDLIGRVVLCTDSTLIRDVVNDWFQGNDRVVVKCHAFKVDTGTDRTSVTLAHYPELLNGLSQECVIHVHGDEASINPLALTSLITRHTKQLPHYPMTQLVCRSHNRDLNNNNSCKVLVEWGGDVLGYSREADSFFTSTGVFSYDPIALMSFHKFFMGPEEIKTNIEQYRLIEMGCKVKAHDGCNGEIKSSIDTQSDLDRMEQLLKEW